MVKNEDGPSEVREATVAYDAPEIPPSAILLEGFQF